MKSQFKFVELKIRRKSLQTASNTKEDLDDSAGKIRINIVSFEKWYANQIKYHKVTGEESGKELKSWSYSVKEVADLLGVDDYLVYELLKKNQIEQVHIWIP